MIKKLSIFLLVIFGIYGQAFGQCPPEGDYRLTTQAQVDDFISSYPDCEEIEGNLTIGQYIQPFGTDINDLSGFQNLKRITQDFRLREIDSDQLFNGLQNIQFIGGDLIIERNDILKNLTIFENLDSIGGNLTVRNNENLDSLFKSNTINHIGKAILISFNEKLISVDGFRKITSVNNGIEISNCPSLLNLAGFNALTSINGNLILFNTGISDLAELSVLEEIVGQQSTVNIIDNLSLTSLQGLNNLGSIEGSFKLDNNPNLNSLLAFESLGFIGGRFEITASNLIDLAGLENTELGFRGLNIEDNNILTSLNPIKISVKVDGSVRINGNEVLSDISALEKIDSIFGGLTISNNNSLSDCESVCILISEGFVENPIIISKNLEGCNSKDEITVLNCTTSVNELIDNITINVFPNPVNEELKVRFTTQPQLLYSSVLYNSLGQIIKEEILENKVDLQKINLRNQDVGIYYLVIKSNLGTVIKKIVKS